MALISIAAVDDIDWYLETAIQFFIFIWNEADLSYLFNPVLRLTNTESGTYLRCLNLKAAPGKQEIIGIIQD